MSLDVALFGLLHILVFVYWLGGDLGAFYASWYVSMPKVSADRRLLASRIVGDVDMAPRTALILALSTGQACQSIARIYVDREIYLAFLDRLCTKAKAVRLNWPDIARDDIGPIIFAAQAEMLRTQIADAVVKGARVLTGGEIETHGGGLWLRPTILDGVTSDMLVMQEETFGPILPVIAFGAVDEDTTLANASQFGLSAAVFAGALAKAKAVARKLEAGAISLNDAALTSLFHEAEKNAFKLSGLGASRMGAAGFQRFLRRVANTGAPLPLAAFAEEADGWRT
jgi:succinate-semialdehyde dehydrogenase / glutarate-semialdehyde dehydrogenase